MKQFDRKQRAASAEVRPPTGQLRHRSLVAMLFALATAAAWSTCIGTATLPAAAGEYDNCYWDQQNQYMCYPDGTTTTAAPRRRTTTTVRRQVTTTTARHRQATTSTTRRRSSSATTPSTGPTVVPVPQAVSTTTSSTAEVTTSTSSPPSSVMAVQRKPNRPSGHQGVALLGVGAAGVLAAGAAWSLWRRRRAA